MKYYLLIAWSLLSMVPYSAAIDVQKKELSQIVDLHVVRTLESIEKATGTMALTSFFLTGMLTEECCLDAVITTCFFSQLAHIAANVALLKYKKNKTAFFRTLFPIAVLFSVVKMSVDSHEKDSSVNPMGALQARLPDIVDEGDMLVFMGAAGILGQMGTLCYDCASADN